MPEVRTILRHFEEKPRFSLEILGVFGSCPLRYTDCPRVISH